MKNVKRVGDFFYIKLYILMCECNNEKLIEKEITFEKRYRFSECVCKEEQEVFVVLCKNFKYNITRFGRNCFAAINCFVLERTDITPSITVLHRKCV